VRRYAVDFEISGAVVVEAADPDEAQEVARNANFRDLSGAVEGTDFGRHYVEDTTDPLTPTDEEGAPTPTRGSAFSPEPWTWEVSADGMPTIADAHGEAIATVESGSKPDAMLMVAAPSLRDRLLARMDRCACHPVPYDPANEDHEGRGGFDCTECEADRDAMELVEGVRL